MQRYLWKLSNLQEKAWGANLSRVPHCCLGWEIFWALRHTDSYGLQFCRKQQDLPNYTSLAPELPRTWCTLKLEKHLDSFSCGLDPRFRLLINAPWIYGVWLWSLVERAWATWYEWCWSCGLMENKVGYMEEIGLDKEAQLLTYSMIRSKFIHRSFLRKTLTTRKVQKRGSGSLFIWQFSKLTLKLLLLVCLTTPHLAVHVEGNKHFSLTYFFILPQLFQKLLKKS